MRLIAPAGLIAIATLVACGGHAVKINPDAEPVADRWNAALATPAELQGAMQVRGTGWLGRNPKDSTRAKAHVEIANAAPGGVHPWHVHRGQCGTDMGILGPAEAYKPLKVGGDGTATAEADLPLALPTAGEYFINVHASAQNLKTIVACGNLAPPAQ